VNYQHWFGITDGRFGYGAMVNGFLNNVPKGVRLSDRASVAVHMGVPFVIKGFYEGVHKVNFTMWETDEMHPRFIPWLKQYDQVLVPCHHNVELFSRYHRNVNRVPLGVDGKIWRKIARPENPKFRIHAGGSLWKRKGLDLVIEACKRLPFEHELHIKLAPHARDHGDLSGIPNTIFHREWMTLDEQVEWFNLADVWVAPARGEGFGLMPAQAIACGVPTIVTATSGQAEFAHLATAVIPHRAVPSGGPGKWDQADPADIRAAIIDHHDRLVAHRVKAAENAAKIVDEFSWDKASAALVDAVPAGKLLKDEQFVPIHIEMQMQVNRPVTSSINSTTYRFVPGQTYTVNEGVFQVLWDAGYVLKEAL
jgi:glycosyltransferase involved in cell wall biosynthesis